MNIMKIFNKTVVVLLMIMILLMPDIAHAGYLDPGSGSTLVQAIIASIAAVKNFWSKVTDGVKRMFGQGK